MGATLVAVLSFPLVLGGALLARALRRPRGRRSWRDLD